MSSRRRIGFLRVRGDRPTRFVGFTPFSQVVRDNWNVRFCDNYDGRW